VWLLRVLEGRVTGSEEMERKMERRRRIQRKR
jgi:hypothetical protein